MIKRPINIMFNLENSPTVYHIRSNSRRNQMPSAILQKSRIFIFHGTFPARIMKCLRYRLRFPYGAEVGIPNHPWKQLLGFTILFCTQVWTLGGGGLPAGIAAEDIKSGAGDISCAKDTTAYGDGAGEPGTNNLWESSLRWAPGEDTPAAGDTTRVADLGWCTGSEITAAMRSKADSCVEWIGTTSIGAPRFSMLTRSTTESWCGNNK
jgi:hypothetical protein